MLPRVVLDANVLISGLIARGPPAALISAWLAGRFTLVVSLLIPATTTWLLWPEAPESIASYRAMRISRA